jgi:translocation and assembly module TamB
VGNHNLDEFDRPSRNRRRRLRPWKAIVFAVVVLFIVGLVFLPTILTSRGVLVGLVERYGGLAPLKVDLDRVEAGWFQPIGIQGFQLLDADGGTIVRIGSIQTAKGILGWVMNSTELGTVQISNVEADIVTYEGTSNVEQALKPLLDKLASTETPPQEVGGASRLMAGAIEISDTRLNLGSRDRDQRWMLNVPQLSVTLPREGEVVGPVQLHAMLGAVSVGSAGSSNAPNVLSTIAADEFNRSGTIAAEVKQSVEQQSFELRAVLDHVPLDFWHVVHARLPEIPIDDLRGSVTAKVAGSLVDAERWSFDVQQLSTSRLSIVAPQLVGATPAALEQIAVSGRCTLADARLQLENGQVVCDFANATATAQIPWPLNTPTLAQPWITGAVVDARGAVDLAKLVKTAESLIPLRQDTQLISGTAQFVVSQKNNAVGQPVSTASFDLDGLRAVAAGQQITWDDPLKVELQAGAAADGRPKFAALCSAEFCNLRGEGTLESGSLNGDANLAVLHQRLAQFVDLPISRMTGTADVQMTWSQPESGVVQAAGVLKTTPLVIASTSGGELREPAWNGKFSATTRLVNSTPVQVDVAQLDLTSDKERLVVELREPMRLVAASPELPAIPPAAFTFQLTGDLANWQRRGASLKALPADYVFRGNVNLGVEGKVDMAHAEVLQANWRMEPFELSTPQVQVAESQMVGNFKGRVDTSDLARLMVEKLEVQATSFSLGAADAATNDGSGSRIGRAAFLVDLGKLMNNVRSGGQPRTDLVLPPGAEPPTQTFVTGRTQGMLNWQVSTAAATFNLESTLENIAVESRNAVGATVAKLWDEPTAKAILAGKYEMATGAVTMDATRFELPWINYAGTMNYKTVADEQSIVIKGQAIYDAAKVAERIKPWTGGQVQLAGQKTVPIDVLWKGKANSVGSSLAGLQAATRLGWEQARVVGINIGAADVPVSVNSGQLASTAEIPVSGGVVRWDVASDLTSQEMLVYQKPMVVLENVAITPEMCQSWLKYVAPLIAEATSVEGRLSLKLDQATLNPTNPRNQTVVGQLLIHKAEIGPGPLSNQIISVVQQINAIRKQDFTQSVSTQKVWVQMPEQKINFEMHNGQVAHRNLNFHVGDVTISSSGTVDIDGRMEMVAAMPIPDSWVQKSPLLVGMQGQTLQFPVRGTLTSPQLDMQSIKQFGRQQVQQAASGMIQQQLTKGLGKLFGAPTAPQAPVQGSTGP